MASPATAIGSSAAPLSRGADEHDPAADFEWVEEGSGAPETAQRSEPSVAAAAVAPPAQPGPLQVEATLVRPCATLEAQEFQAVLSVVAPALDESARVPVRLVAVLDKSGSMRGQKLELVRQTMHDVLRHLGRWDQLGIVEYDTEVKVAAPLTVCDSAGKLRLKAALDRLKAGSQTNLSGGLLKGLDLHHMAGGRATTPCHASHLQRVRFGNTYKRLSDEEVQSRATFATGPLPAGAKRENEWTMELRFERPQDEALVQHVTYSLHPTFSAPEVQVTEPPFNLTRHGWGTFLVRAEVVLRDGRALQLQHDLTFGPPETFQTLLLPLERAPESAPELRIEALGDEAEAEEAVVRSAFLFTDGLANVGIQQPEDLCAAAMAKLDEMGARRCTVSTFGFGSDHSGGLLQGLAEAGGGVYRYIADADQIGEAFGEALGGLFSTTHQNVQLSLKLAPGVSVARACTEYAVERSEEHGVATLSIETGDLFAEERRDILVSLALPPVVGGSGRQTLGHLSVRAFSVLARRTEAPTPVELAVERQEEVAAAEREPHVERHHHRYLTTEALKAARLAAHRGGLEAARQLLRTAAEELSRSPLAVQGDETTLSLLADLNECKGDLRDHESYRALADKKMACMQHGHAKQRCANMKNTEMYSNTSSAKMKSRFKGGY